MSLEVPPWKCTICDMEPVLDVGEDESLELRCQCVRVHVMDGQWMTEVHKPEVT